jgi:chemotaxis protein CheD
MNSDENSNTTPNLYYDHYFECEAVKILPGEYYVTTGNKLIVTVLGSCVSVCMRDRVSGIGGMNHFLLPTDDGNQQGLLAEPARYGCYAMELLINHLLKSGTQRNRLEAKVFGGGNVLRGLAVNHVGERNAEFVLDYLNKEAIPIVAQDLLGTYARKVYFFPYSGKVLVKKIQTLNNTTIMDRESEYRLRVRNMSVAGDVEIFSEK